MSLRAWGAAVVVVLLVVAGVLVWNVGDGGGASSSAAVTAGADRVEVPRGEPATIDVTVNDHAAGGGPVRVARIVGGPLRGTATVTPSGQVLYTPPADGVGIDRFGYEVVDGSGQDAIGEVSVDVGDTTHAVDTAIAWTRCTFPEASPVDQQAFAQAFAHNRCATLDVPVDYSDPGKGTLQVFATERPSTAPDPLGPLFVNQGGPGAEAAYYSTTLAANPDLARFDIVGMDPRGTGRSTHPACSVASLDVGPAAVPAPGSPPTALETQAAAVAASCATDPHLAYFGSNSAARDMDRIRQLMGAPQLTYFGKSYGSDLGTAYATLFPTRLRAAVLDGASDLTLDPVDFVIQQARAGRAQLDRYLAHCRASGCPWTRGQDPTAAWTALLTRLDEHPLTDQATGTVVDGAALRDWQHQHALDTDAELDTALDDLVLRGDVGAFAQESSIDPPMATAFLAVTCLDLPTGSYRAAAARLAAAVPDPPTDSLEVLATCGAWPVRDPIRVGAAAGAGPILVVGTTGDVPTPYASAVALAGTFSTGRLLTWEADAHTAYFFSRCVATRADEVLLDRRLPAVGTRCRDPLGWWMSGAPPSVDPVALTP